MHVRSYRRPFKSPIILTTLPHFAAALIVADVEPAYAAIIAVSSALSVAWHWLHEPAGILFFLDYGAAAVWMVADCWLSFRGGFFLAAAALNGVSLAVNQAAARVRKGPYWDRAHAAWHILNVAKAIWIAYLVRIAAAAKN